MLAALVTNHKGGVGKTFTAVHLASILAEEGRRVLLVDCDRQYDAFRFLTGSVPKEEVFLPLTRRLHVLANGDCVSLRRLGVTEENYDHVLLDADAGIVDAIKNILENRIRVVLAPVNQQSLGVRNLQNLVAACHGLFDQLSAGVAGTLLVVPLAAKKKDIQDVIDCVPKSVDIRVLRKMKSQPRETDEALKNSEVMWRLNSLSPDERSEARDYFRELAEVLKTYV